MRESGRPVATGRVCDYKNERDATVCANCGTRLDIFKSEVPPPPPPPAARHVRAEMNDAGRMGIPVRPASYCDLSNSRPGF